jgi:hypothetical protein
MAVLVAISPNHTLTSPDWRVSYAYNISPQGGDTALTSPQNVPLAFASNSNMVGVDIALSYPTIGSAVSDRDITVKLQQYVAGAWADVVGATVTKTAAVIRNSATLNSKGYFLVKFDLPTPIAVTTAASTWRLVVSQGAGSNNWYLRYSSAGNFAHVTYSDVTGTPSSGNDALIVAGDTAKCTINSTFATKAYLGAGETTVGYSVWLGRNTDPTVANVCNLVWENPPASSYTFTIDGCIAFSTHSGFRIGTSALPIPIAQQARVVINRTPSVGSVGNVGFVDIQHVASGSDYGSRMSLMFYGEVLTKQETTLAYDSIISGAATISIASPAQITKAGVLSGRICPVKFTTTGALPTGIVAGTIYWGKYLSNNNFNIYPTYADAVAGTNIINTSGTQSGTHTCTGAIITVDDVSSEWQAGDIIHIGKRYIKSWGGSSWLDLTINTVSGTEITTTAPGVTYATARAGAMVINISRRGVYCGSDVSTIIQMSFRGPANFVLKGVNMSWLSFSTIGFNSPSGTGEAVANRSQWLIEDSVMNCNGGGGNLFMGSLNPPEDGLKMNRAYFIRMTPAGTMYAGGSSTYGYTGTVIMTNCLSANNNATNMIVPANSYGYTFTNNRWEHANSAQFHLAGSNHTFENNAFWGSSVGVSGATYASALSLGLLTGGTFSGNSFDNNTSAIQFTYGHASKEVVWKDCTFGTEEANTTDFYFAAGSVVDFELQSPTGALTIDPTYSTMDPTFGKFAITSYNDTTGDDRVYTANGKFQKCGFGLVDTITYITGGYSLRSLSEKSTIRNVRQFEMPIGNRQGLATTFGLMCYIGNANYYAGVHEMPRLVVEFDNGTETYGEAGEIVGDWQPVTAKFIPTTSFASVKIKLTTMTDALGADAYVYWGAWDKGGYMVNTDMEYWAKGFPVDPAFAFNVNAGHFLGASAGVNYGSGSIGEIIKAIQDYLEMKL